MLQDTWSTRVQLFYLAKHIIFKKGDPQPGSWPPCGKYPKWILTAMVKWTTRQAVVQLSRHYQLGAPRLKKLSENGALNWSRTCWQCSILNPKKWFKNLKITKLLSKTRKFASRAGNDAKLSYILGQFSAPLPSLCRLRRSRGHSAYVTPLLPRKWVADPPSDHHCRITWDMYTMSSDRFTMSS